MVDTSVSDRDQRRGIDKLSDICNYLLQTYTRGPDWLYPEDEEAFNLLLAHAVKLQQDRLVPVYRHHQPTMWSRCMLGKPCEVCAPHQGCKVDKQLESSRGVTGVRFDDKRCRLCRRGNRPACPQAEPAPPAFTVTKTVAVKWVRLGLATFVNSQRGLRLAFSKATQLRGASVRIDEAFLLAYACGKRYAVETIDGANGWRQSATAQAFTVKAERAQIPGAELCPMPL